MKTVDQEFINDEATAGYSFAVDYQQKTEALKEKLPNCIVVPGFDSLRDYLRHHTWCTEQCIEAYPWSITNFRKLAGKELPFILLTPKVREYFWKELSELDPRARNAKRLFDPQDLHDWFARNLITEVETVLVPISMMAENPDALREEFLYMKENKLKAAYANRVEEGIKTSTSAPAATMRRFRLSSWGLDKGIKREFQKHIFKWYDDLSRKSEEQRVGLRRVHFKRFKVPFPKDKLPKMMTLREVSKTRDYSSVNVGFTTIASFGWARHTRIDEKGNPLQVVFSQGLAVGDPKYWQDYEIGFVDLMTAERFVDAFGVNALQNAAWRLDKSLCSWAAPDAKFGPGLPPKELAVLIGVNWR